MAYQNLKEIFDEYVNVSIDNKFLERITKWRNKFYSKNSEHVGFFSSASFGLYIPKWTSEEDDEWLTEIIGIDEEEIADYVYELPSINKDFQVSSNILSISFIYLMHKATISKSLTSFSDKVRKTLMEILVARYMTSIMYKYFYRGKTSPEVSTEVFERLSKRFDLKVAGNWKNWIEMKAEGFVLGDEQRQDAKYAKQEVFQRFEDELVVRKLNSIKSQLNKAAIEINSVFRQVLEDQDKIASKSALSMSVDGLYLADLVRDQTKYLHYQDAIFIDKNTFIKEDLLAVIEQSMPTISSNIFRGALEWILDNQMESKYKRKIMEVRHDILIYAIQLIKDENLHTNDLVQVGYRLRQNILSGKNNDRTVIKVRKMIDEFIVKFRPQSKGKFVSLERSAIMIYIVLRTLAMNYYKA